MSAWPILPTSAASEVEQYVESELRDAAQFVNRTPLDESGIHALHALGARLYALGFEDGDRTARIRHDGERRRERERGEG